MRFMVMVEHVVAVLVLSIMVFAFLMALVNCIVPCPREVQSARMESTLELYRAFDLNPVTVKLHNEDVERQAVAWGGR